jgi:hypothetical protein
MSWIQLHQRMAFMADVIDRAAEDPDAALRFEGGLGDVERLFGSEEGLLLSLWQRWVTALTAKLDQAVGQSFPTQAVVADLAVEQPALRALIDLAARRSPQVRALRGGEAWIVELHERDTRTPQSVA